MRIDKLISGSILSFTLILFLTSTSFGQNSLKLGNNFFKEGEYSIALRHYNDYLKNYSDKDIFLKRGICNYHCGNYKLAIEDFENSKYLGSFDIRIDKYLALVYHEKQDFEKAVIYYKKLLSKFKGSKKERNEIINNIKRCANGVLMGYNHANNFIDNCGTTINSKFDDILPIQSPNDSSVFYFASNRDYSTNKPQLYDEIRVGYINGNWEEIPPVIKEKDKDEGTIFLDFYEYGDKALVFRGSYLNSGELYSYSHSNTDSVVMVKKKFTAPLYSESDFSYVQFVNDSTILFSSNQKGGYGGYDIYISGYRNGHWFKPINLGPKINTEFDEISPYMTPDAENLYYSSNGLKSLGGFDIFHSEFGYSEYEWLEPVNLGMPINSPFDEYGYRFLRSGKAGIFNSNRKDLGLGGQDIYWVYYKKATPLNDGYLTDVPCLRYKHLTPTMDVVNEEDDNNDSDDIVDNDNNVVVQQQNNIDNNPNDVVVQKQNNIDSNINDVVIEKESNIDSNINDVVVEKKSNINSNPNDVVVQKQNNIDSNINDVVVEKESNIDSNINDVVVEKKSNINSNPNDVVVEKQNNIDSNINDVVVNEANNNIVNEKDSINDSNSRDKEEKEFFIPLIFTNSEGIRGREAAYNFLNRLGRLMKKYPILKVEIVGNNFSKGGKGVDIMNSVSIAQNFADSLKLRMIKGDRIIVRGVGDNFPIANPNGPSISKNIISKFNNRLDIYLHNYKDTPIVIKRESMPISRKIKDDREELYRSNLIGLSYKVLIRTGDFLSYDELLNKYPDSWIEADSKNKKFYYTVGLYQKYKNAKTTYDEIIKIKSSGIEVIPYINGIRISKKEALEYAKTYSDLVNYLEDN